MSSSILTFTTTNEGTPFELGQLTATSFSIEKTTATQSLVVVDVTPQPVTVQHANVSNDVTPTTYTHEVSTSSNGYFVQIDGTLAVKNISLRGTTGVIGDHIVRTNRGAEWEPDLYSRAHNLDSQPTVWAGEYSAHIIDPRNGFTQYCHLTNDNVPGFTFILEPKMPLGRVWRVRVEVDVSAEPGNYTVDPWRQDLYADIDNTVNTDIIWLNANDELTTAELSNGLNLYEFYTYDGGETWKGMKLRGFDFAV